MLVKKKRIIVIIVIGLLIMLSITLIYFNEREKPVQENTTNIEGDEESGYKVPVSSWNDSGIRYIICTIENDDIYTNFSESRTNFQSDLSLKELAEQNEDFIAEIKWMTVLEEFRANLYFSDNNYYLLVEMPETETHEKYYEARSVGGLLSPETGVKRAFAPLPMDYIIGEGHAEIWYDAMEMDYTERFFECISYEDACKFYERYTNGIAEIDYENQRIYVDARELAANVEGLMDNYLCIDFANHRFILDEGGEHEEIYGPLEAVE